MVNASMRLSNICLSENHSSVLSCAQPGKSYIASSMQWLDDRAVKGFQTSGHQDTEFLRHF